MRTQGTAWDTECPFLRLWLTFHIKGSLDGWKHTVCIVCVSHTLPSPIFGIYIAGTLYERVEFTGEQRGVQPKFPPCHACCRVNIGDFEGHPGYPSCWEGCVSYTNGFQGLGCLGSTCVHSPVPSIWEYWPMIECGSVVMHRWDTDGEHLQGKLVLSSFWLWRDQRADAALTMHDRVNDRTLDSCFSSMPESHCHLRDRKRMSAHLDITLLKELSGCQWCKLLSSRCSLLSEIVKWMNP